MREGKGSVAAVVDCWGGEEDNVGGLSFIYLCALPMQQTLRGRNHLGEERWRCHVEPFLADVVPLEALQKVNGFDHLVGEHVEAIAVLLVCFELPQPFRCVATAL